MSEYIENSINEYYKLKNNYENEINKQKNSFDVKKFELLLMVSEQKIIYYEEIEFNNFYNQNGR